MDTNGSDRPPASQASAQFEGRFRHPVTSAEQLAALIGVPGELAIRKELKRLDRHMVRFIEQAPLVLLGTVGRNGQCDVSPRGDWPNVAQVLDSQTLIVPERAGNRRADSLRNIIETGRIGLLFVIPGLGETLRVNGRACVVQDEEVLQPLTAHGKTPVVAVAVEVEECFLQCAKALIRSRLWQPPEHSHSSLPTFAEILVEQTCITGQTVESLARQIEESYAQRLY